MNILKLTLLIFLTTRLYQQQSIDQPQDQQDNGQEQPQTDNGQQQDQQQGQQQVPPQDNFYMASDEEIKQDFYNLDKDENGLLDPHEIRTGIPGIFEDDITGFFSAYDYNKDGVITLEEYMTISRRKNKPPQDQQQQQQDNQQDTQTTTNN